MRPTANIGGRGHASLQFLNSTTEQIFVKRGNEYVELPNSPIRIIPSFITETVEFDGVVLVHEIFDGFKFAKVDTNNEGYLRGKILVVQEKVFCLSRQELAELRKILGIVGVAIPDLFEYRDDKLFVDVLRVKFF